MYHKLLYYTTLKKRNSRIDKKNFHTVNYYELFIYCIVDKNQWLVLKPNSPWDNN